MTKIVERIEMKDIFLLDAQIVVWKGRTEVLKIIIYVINPLTLKTDKHLISPYNITPKSDIKVGE